MFSHHVIHVLGTVIEVNSTRASKYATNVFADRKQCFNYKGLSFPAHIFTIVLMMGSVHKGSVGSHLSVST